MPQLEKRQADAEVTLIEVTPEMVEGGAKILRDIFDAGQSNAEGTARDVFEAMMAFAPIDGAKP